MDQWVAMKEEATQRPKKRSKIYTKTGDDGTSGLYNGERASKDDVIFEALGTVDELNAHLGKACEYIPSSNHRQLDELHTIQSILMDIGSSIATPVSSSTEEQLKRVAFDPVHVERMESWIDEMDARLPHLRNFILPSGGLVATELHIARTVCRRAERRLVELKHHMPIDPHLARYINRLSDYLFVTARFEAQLLGRTETIYKKQ